MREDSLDRLGRAADLGDDGVVVVRIKPADVANLSAGVGVEGGLVEDDFNFFAGLGFLNSDAIFNDGEDFCAFNGE